MHARDAHDLARFFVGPQGAESRVARAVELRPRVVRHAAVDCDPRPLVEPLHRSHSVQRDAGLPYEAASRLEPDRRLAEPRCRECLARRTRGGSREGCGLRDIVVRVVADAEASAEVGDARIPAERVTARGPELGQTSDRLRLCGEVRQLRAHVHVQAEHVEAAVERIGDERLGLLRREPELRAVVAGDDGFVSVRVDAERHPNEHLPDTCRRCEVRLVGRVEDDWRAFAGRLTHEDLVLVVPMHDELGTPETRRARQFELPDGRDVRAYPFLAQKAEQRCVRECLRPVEDSAFVADGGSERAPVPPERVLAVDDQGSPEALGELLRSKPAEQQLAVFDAGGIREQLQLGALGHRAILPVTISVSCSSFLRNPGSERGRRRDVPSRPLT